MYFSLKLTQKFIHLQFFLIKVALRFTEQHSESTPYDAIIIRHLHKAANCQGIELRTI